MTASQKPSLPTMEGLLIQGEAYVRERDARRTVQAALAMNGNSTLLGLLRDIISHWERHGSFGMDEQIEKARRAVSGA